jgi:hypothetical protein
MLWLLGGDVAMVAERAVTVIRELRNQWNQVDTDRGLQSSPEERIYFPVTRRRGAAGTNGAPATWEPLRSTPQQLHQARRVLRDDAPRSHGVNGVRNGPHPDGRRKRGVERPGAFRPHRKTLTETRNFQ